MTTAINRTTVGIPTPSGEQIEAGYYQPDGAGPFHAVLWATAWARSRPGVAAIRRTVQPRRIRRRGDRLPPMGRLDGSTARRGVGGHPALRAEPCPERRIRTRCTAPVHLDSWRRALRAGVLPAARSVGRSEPAPSMGRWRATGPDASCGASRVTVAAAVKPSAASDPIMNPSNDSRA
jgi:hypothetical protein